MTDPYNTATAQTRTTEPDTPPAAPRPALRTPRRAAASDARSERAALLPVLNLVALLVSLGVMGSRGAMSFGAFVFGCGPLLLAMVASLWVRSSTFVTVVRWLNAVGAAIVLLRLMRYASLGIFHVGMLVVFGLAVLVPVLNALYLRGESAK